MKNRKTALALDLRSFAPGGFLVVSLYHQNKNVGQITRSYSGYNAVSSIEGISLEETFPQFLDAVQFCLDRVVPTSLLPPSGNTGGSGDNSLTRGNS